MTARIGAGKPKEVARLTQIRADDNLTDISQFPGAYDERRMGVAFGGGGGGDLWLQNNAGVIMHLKAASEGLMLSLGADVVDIRMSQ
jgi:hypothetical protein